MTSAEAQKPGSLLAHRKAEVHMGLADQARKMGHLEIAKLHDGIAAYYEEDTFNLTPPDFTRTRGIIAVSTIALFRKAGDYENANRAADIFLNNQTIAKNPNQGFKNDIIEMQQEARAILKSQTRHTKKVTTRYK